MKFILIKFFTLFVLQALFLSYNAYDFGENDLIENDLNSRRSSLLERLIDEASSNYEVDNVKYAVKRSAIFKPKLIEDDDENSVDNDRYNEELLDRINYRLLRNGNRKNFFDKRGGAIDTDLCRSVVCSNTPINGQIAKTWKLVQQLTCCRRHAK